MLNVAAVVFGYLLGSIPFGLVITRFAGLGDIRAIGSGNIGATNVLRTGRKDLALATLVLDGGKGAIAVVAASAVGLSAEFAGAAAFLGHCFPVWLRFKGGKGVATFLGTLIALWPPAGVVACAVWLAVARVFRFSSLAALVAASAAPFVLFAMGRPGTALAAAFMTAIIFVRHRSNVDRLIRGAEPKIGAKKTDSAPAPAPADGS
ncbi:MAG: glycerol-3-phosphate 1-O-acyltransferase PlsY [Parvularculaceae bacterium]